MANGALTVTYVDYDGDKIQTSIEGVVFSAANFDAQVTAQNAIVTALDAILLTTRTNSQRTAVTDPLVVANPTNPFAQTNIQWIVEYTDDSTGGVYQWRFGGADLSLADTMYNGAPALNVGTGGAGNDLAVALEAYARHEGNAITVNAIYFRE